MKQDKRIQPQSRSIALDHHIFTAGEWRRAKLRKHPRIEVQVSVLKNGKESITGPNKSTTITAITDSGAQSNIWSQRAFHDAGFPRSALSPVSLSLKSANSSSIKINGAFFARISGTSPHGEVLSCQTMVYVSDQVSDLFLSHDTMVDLLIVSQDFPEIGSATPCYADPPPIAPLLTSVSIRSMNAGCTDDTSSHGTCNCPQRESVPPLPSELPFKCVPENNACMKLWLLERYKASTFNTCPHRPLPCMSGPPVEIHLAENATPRTCHTAAPIPLHWQQQVHADLLRDEALGVILLIGAIEWLSRESMMVVHGAWLTCHH